MGVCLALRTLVREVKRTLAIVGSWIGPLSIKYGLDSRAPQQKLRMIGRSDHPVFCIIDLQVNIAIHSHTVLYSAVWNVYVVCTTDDVQ